ncbi:MAG: hypothetical protein Ct9H90mP5_11580 [Acidimicrobiaceae bacterium]|nr:MAG: hypothetical protein Ct9H90mP5_11580 [Acidimicrobiaceae bacterium]
MQGRAHCVVEIWDNYDSLHQHFDHENYFNMGNLSGAHQEGIPIIGSSDVM